MFIYDYWSNCLIEAIRLRRVLPDSKIKMHKVKGQLIPHFYVQAGEDKFHFTESEGIRYYPIGLLLYKGRCDLVDGKAVKI